MGLKQSFSHAWRKCFQCCAGFILAFVVASSCHAQNQPAKSSGEEQALQKLGINPALIDEFSRILEKFRHEIHFPAGRSESHLLPLLPESTLVYVAFPNYGDAAHQALQIFQQELKDNKDLRDWWHRGDMAVAGPKIEDFLDKTYQLGQFLGDEIAASGRSEGKDPKVLIVAEVRKPGMKQYLEKLSQDPVGKSVGLRILEPKDLETAKELSAGHEFGILVRPEYVAGAFDLPTLRDFNSRIDRGGRDFANAPFGRRVVQAYQDRAMILEAADLQQILKLIPNLKAKDRMTLERTGFADMKYLVWEQADLSGQRLSQGELSFTGPRRGIASWLAAPAPLDSLDFVSPKAMVVASIVLKNPALIFDDVKDLSAASNPNSFAMLDAFEQSLKISLRDDLLGQLGGEVTFELDKYSPTQPDWKIIARVKDAAHLQRTLVTLMAFANIQAAKFEDGGVTYYTFEVPSGKKTVEVDYSFVGGYLVAGSSREIVAQGVQMHKNGRSLGKSKEFLAALPPGHPTGISGLFYEDPAAVARAAMPQLSPDLAGRLAEYIGQGKPILGTAYGEESAIRGAGGSPAFSTGVVMVIAAAAIPNFLRARIAANEASAVGTLRTVNTAEHVYVSTYSEGGFAPDLAKLGPGPNGNTTETTDHANLLDAAIANPNCTATAWCEKSGYRFRVTGVCKQSRCKDYVVTAIPVSEGTGNRSFCSSSDGVIRYQTKFLAGNSQPGIEECRAWPPLQ